MKMPNPVVRRYKCQKISHNGGDSGHVQPCEQLEGVSNKSSFSV